MPKKENPIEAMIQPEQEATGSEMGPTSPEWTDFVLSQMTEHEVDQNKNPKADGLRRIAEKLLGIFDIETHVVQAPGMDGRATVLVRLRFHNSGRVVSGVADVFSGNTDRVFAAHASATAETRAEGRALRKALRLTKVLTAEEMQGAAPDEPTGDDGRITSAMLTSLRAVANKQKIDLEKLSIDKFKKGVEDLKLIEGRSLSHVMVNDISGKEIIGDEYRL